MINRLLGPLKGMSRGGVVGSLAALMLFGVVLFFGAARWVNTSPSQCATCHPSLTAMWQRSHGHPSEKVSCHDCHAAHPAPPPSLNVGAVVRDQLVPEKYRSSDTRVEARCEGCHPRTRTTGTGPELIEGKEWLRRAANWIGSGPEIDHEVILGALPDHPKGGGVPGRDLLGAAVRQLRAAEWALAFAESSSAGSVPTVATIREPLEFSEQALRWVRLSETKVREGVVARIRSRLTLYKGEMSRVRRGIGAFAASLETVLSGDGKGNAGQVEKARSLLEGVSRGLRGADRARAAIIRELGGLESAIFDPDRLAKALRVIPKALRAQQFGEVQEALEAASDLMEEAGTGFDSAAIENGTERHVTALTVRLQEQLSELKRAFAAVLEDLPSVKGGHVEAGARVDLPSARMIPISSEQAKGGQRVPVDPWQLVQDALTAVRSLEVSLGVASNLGWSDLSLPQRHVQTLAETFVALDRGFLSGKEANPGIFEVRRCLEQAVVALTAAERADGLSLTFQVEEPSGGGPLGVSLRELVGSAVDAMAELEARLEKRKIVKVNHKVHFLVHTDAGGRPVDLGCLDCHRNIAHDKARVETFRPRMAGCFVGDCHRPDRNKDNCRRCHFQQLQEMTARVEQ